MRTTGYDRRLGRQRCRRQQRHLLASGLPDTAEHHALPFRDRDPDGGTDRLTGPGTLDNVSCTRDVIHSAKDRGRDANQPQGSKEPPLASEAGEKLTDIAAVTFACAPIAI
jgi:hypothetical protein